ncbi:MAG: hypothetical protein DCC67_12835 [Planctomycetota bacterium]|nr:MAG: hypothetical protein DCC67_12835 [Planctomycetota bacterium]
MPTYARYRAPAESGQKLVAPPWNELERLPHQAAAWRRTVDVTVVGQPLEEFAGAARREVLAAAEAYVASYANDGTPAVARPLADAYRPLILTGHQPELFHPGVWVKNFASDRLARLVGGQAVNLIIDGDACQETSIRVPLGTPREPRLGVVEFDRHRNNAPWEDRGIADRSLWESFADRVRAAAGMLSDRMLDQWWPAVLARGEQTGRVGAAIAQARHLVERSWGRHTLELPQSRLSTTAAFRRFAYHLLLHLPRFAAAYNEALVEYRRAHKIRNHAQPVPNLGRAGDWLEAPFWVWSAAAAIRRPAYVRFQGRTLVVSDRKSFEQSLPMVDDGDAAVAVDELQRWEDDGCRLRSRALATTMFARLAVADLFIHGIGGARYDEATDAICERFFGAAPPPFATVSGTLRLPIAVAEEPRHALRDLRRRLRDLQFHPEWFVRDGHAGGEAEEGLRRAVASKQMWVGTPKTAKNAAERHRGIAAANAELRQYTENAYRETAAALRQANEQARAAQILNSRQYAFCLFPLDELRHFLLDF